LKWLAAIRADPDDDAPSLLLADWLDEHGDSAGDARQLVLIQTRLHGRLDLGAGR
jgi:uncharacterized protein (TIGR02996 family)